MRIRVEGPRSSHRLPLVFVHGAGASATVWLDVFRHFERDRLVIAPDLPGHGQSDPVLDIPDEDRIAHYRDVVGAVCAHLDVARAIFVGHSMGGLIALSAAATFPDKVAGAVLLSTASEMQPGSEMLATLVANPKRQPEILAELGWSPATPRDTVSRWMRTVTSTDPDMTLADLRAVARFTSPRAELVRAPLSCIGGQDDLMCPPALVKSMEHAFARCEVTLLPEAGHQPHLEQPAATISAIERFASFA